MSNNNLSYILFFCCNSAALFGMLLDSVPTIQKVDQMLDVSQGIKKSLSGRSVEMVSFSYKQTPLEELLHEYAEKMSFNILYPETEKITAQVTFDAGKQVTITEGWDLVLMILEMAGYSLIPRLNNTYVLVATSKVVTDNVPLYIGMDYTVLPDSMERVRYIYYCANIQVIKHQADLQVLFKTLLGVNDDKDKSTVFYEPHTNGLIITARADVIKSAMQVIKVLDESGPSQCMQVLFLKHAQSKDIVDLFGKIIVQNDDKKGPVNASISSTVRARYFSDAVRVMDLDPKNIRYSNNIVIVGKQQDVAEVIKFIEKYLDIPQDIGQACYHVIELEWLKATDFVEVLQSLITNSSATQGGSGQSTTGALSDLSFDPHIRIIAESTKQGSSGATSATGGSTLSNTVQRGANKLIVACSHRDWQRIEQLIKLMDKPQQQVVIEAIVMDLDSQFTRKLAVQMRTQGIVSSIFPKHMQAQAGLVTNNIISGGGANSSPNDYGLTGDLSDILNPDGVAGTGGVSSLTNPSASTSIPNGSVGNAATTFNGNTIFMISGGKNRTNGAWAFFQLLSQNDTSKIFTRPIGMVLNNHTFETGSMVTKQLASAVTASTNPTVNFTPEPAPISIKFTPLISQNKAINLQVDLDLTQYLQPDSATAGTKIKRALKTNVTMRSGDVLVLGGLLRERSETSRRGVPLLDRIPIIGNLFSSRTKQATQSRLFIIVRATVVDPKITGGMSKVTKSAANFMVDQLAEVEDNFMNLKDPITRWFFSSDHSKSSSELLEDKFHDLPRKDYGIDDASLQKTANQMWHDKVASPGADIRIGWFSADDSSLDPSVQGPLYADQQQDEDDLLKMLAKIENPYNNKRYPV